MRPHNLRIDLSPDSLVPVVLKTTQQPTEVAMSTQATQRGKLPLSRSQTDPLKRLAFVDAEIIPSDETYSVRHSRHRYSTDSSDGEHSVRSRSPMSGPNYNHTIDKPTSTYAASLARRSRANTTDNTPSHSPTRLPLPRCPHCGAHRQLVLPPSTSTAAERACSPPRSKHFLNLRNNLSTTLCDACIVAERARLTSRQSDENIFVPLYAYLGSSTDDGYENRPSRRRRRRGSSGGNAAGDN